MDYDDFERVLWACFYGALAAGALVFAASCALGYWWTAA